MILKILKRIHIIFKYSYLQLIISKKNLFFFILPNLFKIICNKVDYKNTPTCSQKTFLTGAGTIQIGKNCAFGFKLGGFNRGGSVEIQPRYKDAKIIIGDNVATNNNVFICAANYIKIGDNTLFGQNVFIIDYEAHNIDPLKRKEVGEIGVVIIGKNVWFGNNVTVLKNTEIGDNTIVATGAVVIGKFPNNVIIGGIPAKIIKHL